MALNSLYCADVPLSTYSLTHYQTQRAVINKVKQHYKESNDSVTVLFPAASHNRGNVNVVSQTVRVRVPVRLGLACHT